MPYSTYIATQNQKQNMQTTYFKGDRAVYTGKTMTLHGGLFFEIKIVEGHLKGQIKVTQRAPNSLKVTA